MIAAVHHLSRDREPGTNMVAPVCRSPAVLPANRDPVVSRRRGPCHDRELDLYLDLYLGRSNDLSSDPDAS